MNVFILDCAEIQTQEQLHRRLSAGLRLPEYYGCNLDALYDCLTELNRTQLILWNANALQASLKQYGSRFIRCSLLAAQENPGLTLVLA